MVPCSCTRNKTHKLCSIWFVVQHGLSFDGMCLNLCNTVFSIHFFLKDLVTGYLRRYHGDVLLLSEF